MDFDTICIKENDGVGYIQIDRPENRNSINMVMLQEMNEVLDQYEKNPSIKIIMFSGHSQFFCTGADLDEAVSSQNRSQRKDEKDFTTAYMDTLRKLSLSSKVVVGYVRGQTMAGGIGFLAVFDYVLAHYESKFSLSEMLWGLIPSMVTPYLIRKVGFRAAYKLTLSTTLISSEEAKKIMLVDEVVDDPVTSMSRLIQRCSVLECETIETMKQFFRKMWIINNHIESTACEETNMLMNKDLVTKNINNFVLYKKFPWDK